MSENNILKILNEYYGYKEFRKGQENIINSIINKEDVVAIMPTGGGKSICYQIPALFLDGITIVISPLISLMKDQVDTLKVMGIKAELINSSLSNEEYINIINNIKNDEYKMLYVAPERLDNIDFIEIIKDKKISQVAIDEAHCVSQWGHDFRTSYKKIPYFISRLNKRPIITAFTATASEEVRLDIINVLSLNKPSVYISGFDRENLSINIEKSSAKNKYILNYIENHKNESGIIYASTRKDVESIYEGLLKRGYLVGKYHAGLNNDERNQYQEKFINDEIKIMIATNAFGMGIDKSNIRWVIHYNMPQSIENYYQEIGRAGRDLDNSECILLFSQGDVHTQKYLIDVSIDNPLRKENKYKKLQQMTDLVYSNGCLRKNILNYFGDDLEKDCNNCSNCLTEGSIIDKTLDAKKVISCIARMKRSYGSTMIVDVLRGSKNKKVIEQKFDELTTYGIMKNYSNEDLKNFINTLVSHKFLDIVENVGFRGSYPTIKLNKNSLKVIKGELEVKFKESKVSQSKYVLNELYERLILLRSNISKSEKVAPYMIFSDATLRNISITYANTKSEMLNISGIGEVKYEKYGKLFEDVVSEYLVEKNINKDNELKNNQTNKNDGEYFEVSTNSDLYKLLLDYRSEVSKVQGVIPYMIFSSNTLKEMSGRYPLDEEQLNDISGVGNVKIKSYGKDIINIIKEYIKENSIDPRWEYKKKMKLILDGENRKKDEISLDLLNQGKTLKEVSDEVEVSISTILGYVYDYIKEDNKINFELNLDKLYTKDEESIINDSINRFGEDKISVIKKSLPDNIKYESIRAVILKKHISS